MLTVKNDSFLYCNYVFYREKITTFKFESFSDQNATVEY